MSKQSKHHSKSSHSHFLHRCKGYVFGLSLVVALVLWAVFFIARSPLSEFVTEMKEYHIISANDQIILGDKQLNSTVLFVRSPLNSPKVSIFSNCTLEKKHIETKKWIWNTTDIYFLQITDISCKDGELVVQKGNNSDDTLSIDIIKNTDTISALMDTPSTELTSTLDVLSDEVAIQPTNEKEKTINFYQKAYTDFLQSHIRKILLYRTIPQYISPVEGMDVPTVHAWIPNARRPYREILTDGIHHSWDYFAPFGTPVQATSDGIIIRIKENVSWSDFDDLQKHHIDEDVRARNLDIYRGNQVWLKTYTGDVFMYNHLDKIPNTLTEWQIVLKWEILGTMGDSGVPVQWYEDIHLDIALHMNPLDAEKAGKYTELDIMKWDWFGKDQTREWVLENQKDIFSHK